MVQHGLMNLQQLPSMLLLLFGCVLVRTLMALLSAKRAAIACTVA